MKESIRKIRDSLNLSQQDFADLIGVTPSALSRYEKGLRTPKKSTRLLMVLSVDMLKFIHKKASRKGLI